MCVCVFFACIRSSHICVQVSPMPLTLLVDTASAFHTHHCSRWKGRERGGRLTEQHRTRRHVGHSAQPLGGEHGSSSAAIRRNGRSEWLLECRRPRPVHTVSGTAFPFPLSDGKLYRLPLLPPPLAQHESLSAERAAQRNSEPGQPGGRVARWRLAPRVLLDILREKWTRVGRVVWPLAEQRAAEM
jgi:hypothetical protein